jgi:heme exporter protein CcmD
MMAFFDELIGRHGGFIALSYAATILIVLVLTVAILKSHRDRTAELARLDPRRQREGVPAAGRRS